MALNFSKLTSTFKTNVPVTYKGDKAVDETGIVTCEFKRYTKDQVKEVQKGLQDFTGADGDGYVKNVLEEVWVGWNCTDENGAVPFTEQMREFFYQSYPSSMMDVFLAWVKGCWGGDRKNG
ncbi:MAG: hypothetical protein LBB65_07195 [Burkholderiales bacterium]|jgi:hypothetical protein|nr:hypothetical protein [Burkholderiales bacterium]